MFESNELLLIKVTKKERFARLMWVPTQEKAHAHAQEKVHAHAQGKAHAQAQDETHAHTHTHTNTTTILVAQK